MKKEIKSASWQKKHYYIIAVIFLFALLAGAVVLSLPYFPEIPFQFGLDLQGGTHLVYQADLSEIQRQDQTRAMEGLRDVLEKRVDLYGIREPLIQVQKDRLIIELAGITEVSEAIEIIGETPFLEFKELREEEEVEEIFEKQLEIEGFIGKRLVEMDEEDFAKIKEVENWTLIFEDVYQSTPLTGRYLERAEVIFTEHLLKPVVSLQFNEEGGKIFEELTERNIGKPLAIYIDQIEISTPVVQEKITGGKAQITGEFTIEDARKLVQNLNAGALPVPIELISQQTVGPTLGKISLEYSLKAGIIGFLAIILFLIIFYKLPGFLASLSLLFYVIFVLAIFKIFEVTLTLAGIAGFILSIGLAIDANILFFCRLKEEIKKEKDSFFSSSHQQRFFPLEEGFQRAWPAIRDSNITALVVAIILFWIGTGFIKGFGLVLAIGILISIFSVFFITRNLLKIAASTKLGEIKKLW